MTNYTYYLPLKEELDLTHQFIKGLGDHLFNQLDKTPGINIKYLIIEETYTGQGYLHILLETDIPRSTLLEIINKIKLYTPVSLTTKGITPSIIPIFTKYKGKMLCEYYKDKKNCPGKPYCNRLTEDNTLLCEADTNLEELKTTEQLNSQMDDLAIKRGLPDTIHRYYYGAI